MEYLLVAEVVVVELQCSTLPEGGGVGQTLLPAGRFHELRCAVFVEGGLRGIPGGNFVAHELADCVEEKDVM